MSAIMVVWLADVASADVLRLVPALAVIVPEMGWVTAELSTLTAPPALIAAHWEGVVGSQTSCWA
jgi:hypothetical protein